MSFSISEGFRRIAGPAILVLLTTPILVLSSAQPADAETVISQVGEDLDGEAAGDQSGYSVALSSDGTRLAIGATQNDGTSGNSGDNRGHARVYDWNGTAWVQTGTDIDGEAAGDLSGYSVALSSDGTRLAIGAIGNDGTSGDSSDNRGHVRVYDWNGSSWVQTGTDIDGEAAGDQSGTSVSLSSDGTRLAIGAVRNDGTTGDSSDNRGHVRVYDWNGSAWVQTGTDIDGESGDDFNGWRVDLSSDGDRLAVGAYGNDGNGSASGHVRVYDWNGTAWVQTGTDIDGEAAGDQSGTSVSLSSDGNRLAIGADSNDGNGTDSGHVRIYDWNGSAWVQTGTDIDGEAAGDYSGWSIDLSSTGNRVAIGAYGNADNGTDSGHVRIYDWNGSAWVQTGTDIDGEAADDYNGWALSLNSAGSRLAIGAITNGGNGTNSGHTRVFSITTVTSSSTTRASNTQTNTSTPGIFLSIHGQTGDAVNGSNVQFGAYSIQPSSPYVVTIRSGNDITTQRVLASGAATRAGHLDRTITLPALPAGNHTVVLTALGASGQQLILGNTITVSVNQRVSTTTPESLQPTVR